jgi:hypothetical protein
MSGRTHVDRVRPPMSWIVLLMAVLGLAGCAPDSSTVAPVPATSNATSTPVLSPSQMLAALVQRGQSATYKVTFALTIKDGERAPQIGEVIWYARPPARRSDFRLTGGTDTLAIWDLGTAWYVCDSVERNFCRSVKQDEGGLWTRSVRRLMEALRIGLPEAAVHPIASRRISGRDATCFNLGDSEPLPSPSYQPGPFRSTSGGTICFTPEGIPLYVAIRELGAALDREERYEATSVSIPANTDLEPPKS